MVKSTILLKRNTKRIWLSIKGNPPSDQVEAFFWSFNFSFNDIDVCFKIFFYLFSKDHTQGRGAKIILSRFLCCLEGSVDNWLNILTLKGQLIRIVFHAWNKSICPQIAMLDSEGESPLKYMPG